MRRARANLDACAYPHCNAYRDAPSDPCANGDAHPRNAHPHCSAYAHGDNDAYPNGHPYANRNAYPYCDAHAHADHI